MPSSKAQTEATLADLGVGIISERLPLLINMYLGTELITTNEERTRAAALMGFKIGSERVYIPLLFLNGRIKGTEVMYLADSDTFTSASKQWVDYLSSKNPGIMGEGDRGDGLQHPMPSQMQIFRNVPGAGKMAELFNGAADDFFGKVAATDPSIADLPKRAEFNFPNVLRSLGREAYCNFMDQVADCPELLEKIAHHYDMKDLMLTFEKTESKLSKEAQGTWIEGLDRSIIERDGSLPANLKKALLTVLDENADYAGAFVSHLEKTGSDWMADAYTGGANAWNAVKSAPGAAAGWAGRQVDTLLGKDQNLTSASAAAIPKPLRSEMNIPTNVGHPQTRTPAPVVPPAAAVPAAVQNPTMALGAPAPTLPMPSLDNKPAAPALPVAPLTLAGPTPTLPMPSLTGPAAPAANAASMVSKPGAPDPGALAAFRKAHGGNFDRNSAVDRFKMQSLMAGNSKVNTSDYYAQRGAKPAAPAAPATGGMVGNVPLAPASSSRTALHNYPNVPAGTIPASMLPKVGGVICDLADAWVELKKWASENPDAHIDLDLTALPISYWAAHQIEKAASVPKTAFVTSEELIEDPEFGDLSVEDREHCMTHGFVFMDKRAEEEKTLIVKEDYLSRFSKPKDPGFYELINRAGNLEKVFIATNPFLIEHQQIAFPQSIIIDVESGFYFLPGGQDEVLVRQKLDAEPDENQTKKTTSGLPSVSSMGPNKTYMLVSPDGLSVSSPFIVDNKESQDGTTSLTCRSPWDISYRAVNPDSRWTHGGVIASPLHSCSDGLSAVTVRIVDREDENHNITKIGEIVFLPKSWKVIELDSDESGATHPDGRAAYEAYEKKSKAVMNRITPGNQATITAAMSNKDMFKLNLEKKGSWMVLSVRGQNTDYLNKVATLRCLTEGLGMTLDDAMDFYTETVAFGKSARFCKQADPNAPKPFPGQDLIQKAVGAPAPVKPVAPIKPLAEILKPTVPKTGSLLGKLAALLEANPSLIPPSVTAAK